MAFNIGEFKANFESGRYVPESAYEMFVPIPSFLSAGVIGPNILGFNSGLDGAQRLRLRTENISLPGIAFLNVDGHRPYGFGPTYTIPYGLNVVEISTTHICDGRGEIHRIFEEWTSNIVYWQGRFGGSRGLYSANYLKDYAVDITIYTFNEDNELAAKYLLREAFPILIDQVPLSWGSNDQYMKLNVNYKFTDWVILD